MYFIMFNQTEERIFHDIEQVATCLVHGWKLYGYSDHEKQAFYLLNECQNC